MNDIETLGQGAVIVLILSFAAVIVVMGGLLWFGWWVSRKRGSVSPYTKKPMALGIDEFMLSHPQPDNPPIDFETASICPDTGRIFPNTVVRGIVLLDWNFIQRRYPGRFVSWGSLSDYEKATIKLCHDTLAGYQYETSCPKPIPRDIDAYYAQQKPGPLYVDRQTKILLGWKEVPGTELEVMIVQLPIYENIDQTL
jgi:hypothetical protein